METIFQYERSKEIFVPHRTEGVEYCFGEEGEQILVLDSSVNYPNFDDAGPALRNILLLPKPDIDNHRAMVLPRNYITFTHALNDAIGNWTNTESKQRSIVNGLFYELGADLALVAETEGRIPKELSYKQVMFSRDDYDLKILPPVEFGKTTDISYAKEQLVDNFWRNCSAGATNRAQKEQLPEAFKGFSDALLRN